MIRGSSTSVKLRPTFAFKSVKYSLLSLLILLILIVVYFLIASEEKRTYRPLGIISLVGLALFTIGILGILKEHVFTLWFFGLANIFYLIVCMYARVTTTTGSIISRSLALLLATILSISMAIMIRDRRNREALYAARESARIYSYPIYVTPYSSHHTSGILPSSAAAAPLASSEKISVHGMRTVDL